MNAHTVLKKCRIGLSASCCLVILGGCSSSSSSNSGAEDSITLEQDQTPDNGEVGVVGPLAGPSQSVPDDLAQLDEVALIVNANSRCAAVSEPLELNVSRALTEAEIAAGDPATPPDVSAFVSYTQGLGDSLSLVSVGDGSASFAFERQDIVSLTVELDNGSVTAFLAGIDAAIPPPVVLRKEAPGGCLYALRSQNSCVTGFAKGGTLSLASDGLSISAQGCELSNPGNLPVIELEPTQIDVQ